MQKFDRSVLEALAQSPKRNQKSARQTAGGRASPQIHDTVKWMMKRKTQFSKLKNKDKSNKKKSTQPEPPKDDTFDSQKSYTSDSSLNLFNLETEKKGDNDHILLGTEAGVQAPAPALDIMA